MQTTARKLVESFLRNRLRENEDSRIRSSEKEVIERLLSSGDLLDEAYDELLDQLPAGDMATGMVIDKWHLVIESVIDEAVLSAPEKIVQLSDGMKRVEELTEEIREKSKSLADLLLRRSLLMEQYGISKTPMDFHPIDLLDRAAELSDDPHTPYLYKQWLSPVLSGAEERFDLKYWPTTRLVIEALCEFQENASYEVAGDATRAALSSNKKSSWRGFMRSLDARLCGLERFHSIHVTLSDKARAAFTNAALGFDEDVTPQNMKQYRALERKKRAGND